MSKTTLLGVGLILLGFSQAHAMDVRYDANTLPDSDPLAPWQVLGPGPTSMSVMDGVLHLTDSPSGWRLFLRLEPSLGDEPVVAVEAVVKVPSNSGTIASPLIAFMDYDPLRPVNDISHLTYEVELYPARIDLNKADRDHSGDVELIGTVAVPDLATAFHRITLIRHEERASRRFEVLVDDAVVVVSGAEPTDRPLNAVVFGYGTFEGTGSSEWDYVRYWSERAEVQTCEGTNVALGKPAVASSSWEPCCPPTRAVDGDTSFVQGWNAGDSAPQWIEVDLGAEIPVTCLRLLSDMLPDGQVTHFVEGRTEGGATVPLGSYVGPAAHRQWLTIPSGVPTPVRYVRVTTTVSPSWVAWIEVEVIATEPAVEARRSSWGALKTIYR